MIQVQYEPTNSSEWVQTNVAAYERGRTDLGEDIFDLIEVVAVDVFGEEKPTKDYVINAYTIDLAEYSETEIIQCIQQYGLDSVEAVEKEYKHNAKRVIAEWLFADLDFAEKEIMRFADKYKAEQVFFECFGIPVNLN